MDLYSVACVVTLVLLVLFFMAVASYDYYERKTGVPTFPTLPAVRKKMIELLQKDAEARPAHPYTVLDLGSGSGQLLAKIARAMPQARFIGIELSFIPWLRSVVRQRLFGPKNIEYKRLDFYGYDCSVADAVVTYLPGKVMERVGAKLRKELKPGTLIVTNGFALRADWQPIEAMTVGTLIKLKVFVYRQG
jgi:SAM-dependent methyltransferase